MSKRTYFDLLLAAASTEDCEPMLMVDFEELDEFASLLGEQRSFLLGESAASGVETLGISGKRFLTALKTAVVLMRWAKTGDAEQVAEAHDCYPFEILRLQESMDRLLLAVSGVQRLLDEGKQGDEDEDKEAEKSPEVCQIELLRQMISNGLDERAASLTLVQGIGAKWARKLIAAGICELGALACCKPRRLVELGGISEERARKWVKEAAEKAENRKQKVETGNAPKIRTTPVEWSGTVDPYRLRRALELHVERMENENWLVTGGLEPHRVWSQSGVLTCDCVDHANGHICKHLLAVRLANGDAELRQCARQIEAVVEGDYLDLFKLWFDRKRVTP
jgi:helicase